MAMAEVKSTARTYFDLILSQSDGYTFLSRLADVKGPHYPFFETDWIDFKGAPANDDNAKECWSKAFQDLLMPARLTRLQP